MDLKSVLMGLAFAAIWASAFTATRIVVVEMPPLFALVVRFAISAVIALGLARAMGQSLRLTRDEARTVVIFGLCQNALYLGLNWMAMQRVEASAAAIIASMMPLLVAFFGWAAGREPLRPQAALGLLLGVTGVVVIMSVRLRHGLDLVGVAMCLVAVVALTVATLVVRGTGGGSNLMAIVGWQMAVGAVALALPSLLLEWGEPVRWTPRLVGALAFSIFIPGILATFIWFRLVTRIGAVRAAAFHFLSPPLGVTIAALALGERFGWSDVIGSLIVAAGILMVQLARVPPAAQRSPTARTDGRS
ncbi:DMT family transporter [Paracoccus panacisoli]|uniref:DMT family transporter n=1 Tax=Paracoccus panacisoli TaxID=1510163 RepID=A0ABV6T4L7_9RHOB|nr:DMT family transporter [Paracoccus sanguinis]KGJ14690.1 peptide ABC transporter permease [Paracoccus sanguinis]KGJ21697.1 peptide ABC transporter permease [Paracoccus sanguinis]